MMPDAWLWICAVFVVIFLLFIMVYHLLAFDELRNDHKNPLDVCNNLNPWVLREYGAHAFLTVLFLFYAEWWMLLLNVPLVAYHAKRYMDRPRMKVAGIYDPTEVFNRNETQKNVTECSIKLGFYLLCFFFYLYRMMFALLSKTKKNQ